MTTIILDNPKLEQDIPLEILHADPVQPRVHPDAELAESIKTQGILQAITVEPITVDSIPDAICADCGRAFVELAAEGGHFLILDGERRYRGTIAAGRKTILGKVVPPSTEGTRLLRQLTSSTGKPLTPIEEAFAFQRLMEAQGWSQAELARLLGRPRSVVGDRIRLIDLDQVWLDLIAEEKLQVSHGPELHLYARVPSKYQAEAAKKIREDAKGPDPITVEGFHWDLQQAFQPYIRELGDVGPLYKGPVIEISQYGGKRKFAADPDLWKPVLAEKQKRARQANKSSGAQRSAPRFESVMSKTLKELKAAGYDVPVRKTESYGRLEPKTGETIIFADGTWAEEIHPQTLLEKLDPATITSLSSQYGSNKLVTSDVAAVSAAREAYRIKAAEAAKKVLSSLTATLSDKVLAAYAIRGPGITGLIGYLDLERGDEKTVALALGVDVEGEDISQADGERLLAALAACSAQKIKIPNHWTLTDKTRQSIGNPAFKVAKRASRAQQSQNKLNAEIAAEASKSKQKREARAAGNQVGDPKRAKKEKEVAIAASKDVDVGAMRAAVEAGVQEGELVEA